MLKTLFNINATILSTRHRIMILVLMVMNTIAAGLEALSIYLFLPILEFFKNPDGFRPEDSLPPLLSDFVYSFSHLGLGTFVLVVMVFLLKAIIMSLISLSKNTIVSTIRRDLSTLVFAQSLFQDYQKLVNAKISVLMNNITAGITYLSNGILFSSINIVIELFMITAISFVLIANTSWVSLAVPLVVGMIGIVLMLAFKRWAAWIGRIRQKAETGRMQVLKESFASVLEIKIYRAETYFSKMFQDQERDLKKVGIGVLTMAEIPKYILELLGVLTIFLFFLVSYTFGNADTLLMTNGLFAVAVIKLMPSLNRIIISFNSMRAAIPAYEQVADVFSQSVRNKHLFSSTEGSSSFPSISSLQLSNLSYRYSADTPPIVDGISISLNKGQIYGLIGPSGSGKTTVLNILSGVFAPTSSSAEFSINGTIVDNYGDEIEGHIGYVPQSPQLFNRSIAENVAFDQSPDLIDRDRIHRALASAEALGFVEKLPDGIDHILSDSGMNLSGGQRQRLALARVLYRQPSIIILDEATNALDQDTVDDFMKTIRQLSSDCIVIIVSHSKSMMNFCDETITPAKGNN